jgi:hypothetical protein
LFGLLFESEKGGNMFIQNIDLLSTGYMVLYPIVTLKSSQGKSHNIVELNTNIPEICLHHRGIRILSTLMAETGNLCNMDFELSIYRTDILRRL